MVDSEKEKSISVLISQQRYGQYESIEKTQSIHIILESHYEFQNNRIQ